MKIVACSITIGLTCTRIEQCKERSSQHKRARRSDKSTTVCPKGDTCGTLCALVKERNSVNVLFADRNGQIRVSGTGAVQKWVVTGKSKANE